MKIDNGGTLIDSNVLLRRAQRQSPHHQAARSSINRLHALGVPLYITSQNIIEFWNVATRPLEANGLGLSPEIAWERIKPFERFFRLAPEVPDVFEEWKQVVREAGVSGKQVHDARLVAVMRVHQISHILTFNASDFTRYSGIEVVYPQVL